jgi:hypothetical protein
MLLYEKDGHFLPHRDSEKEDGMFGTLILQLPSVFSGGSLAVKHDGKTKDFFHDKESASSVHVTAFYADCEHEVRRVWSGRRLCLVYNLVADSVEQCPSYSVNANVEAELFRIANYWRGHRAERKLGFPLTHFYTKQNFSFTSMKGEEAHVLTTLTSAKCPRGRPIFEVWLVLMERHFTYFSYDIDGKEYTSEDIRVLKLLNKNGKKIRLVDEETCYWKMFQRPDGWMVNEVDFDDYAEQNDLENWYVDTDDETEDEHYAPNSLRSVVFRKFGPTKHTEGALFTGNEGVPDEYWYHAGAIVISPK